MTDAAYAHGLYHDVVQSDEITSFLSHSDRYDATGRKWTCQNTSMCAEDLLVSVFEMLLSIAQRFVNPTVPGVIRELVYTHNIPACNEVDEDAYRVCPDLVVEAAGPSFSIPRPLDPSRPQDTPSSRFGFMNMACHFCVKPESEVGTDKEIIDATRAYARRIFSQQPNRIYSRSLVITEKYARLVHFDHAGAHISPPFDIHEHPDTLIRLVWTIANGRKEAGTLTTAGPSGDLKAYEIVEQMPTARESICGRATTCWRVQDPDTFEDYVVKDSWRPDGYPPESELLELVKGVPGVFQLVSHGAGRVETKDFRCPSTVGQYDNRAASRVMMKSYGRSIVSDYMSLLELLTAIRDAIAGHHTLVREHRILHRDISHNTVLLGRKDAPEGERGILIDLDLAFKATEEQPTVPAKFHLGTRMFQSLFVLEARTFKGTPPSHDYLDDLESFFYLICYIFLCYRPDGSCIPSGEPGPKIVSQWEEEEGGPGSPYINKSALYGFTGPSLQAPKLVEAVWGPIGAAVFNQFRAWIIDVTGQKIELLEAARRRSRPWRRVTTEGCQYVPHA